MITMKFGGTSVGDAARIGEVAKIVQQVHETERGGVVVVVSAMSGTTDLVIEAAHAAARQNPTRFIEIETEVRKKHTETVHQLLPTREQHTALMRELSGLIDTFGDLCQGIYILGELTPRGLDAVSSLGERLCARILAAVLSDWNVEAVAVDAMDIIVTDDNYGEAAPLMDETYERVRSRLIPLLQAGIIPVATGFLGATVDGVTTTLGRGGSDYSAAIIGSCLDSDEIWIWTDVDGVMTADPRVVEDARTLPEVSYGEMAELSYFGARVLHPKTTIPSMAKGIPLRIKNTFNPQHPGTLIVAEPTPTDARAKSITSIKGVSQITVEGRGMIGVPDIAARVFSTVARKGISVLMLSQSSSGQNICFVVQERSAPRVMEALEETFEREFARQDIDRIWMQDNVAIVAVVGAGMKGTPGIAAKVFGAAGRHGINVISIAQGSSEMNICFVVEEKDADQAVRYVHQEFQLGNMI